MRTPICTIGMTLTLASTCAYAASPLEEPDAFTEVTAVAPPTDIVSLKLDRQFNSLKYVLFFTPGSAQLGPRAKRTIDLLVPAAKVADEIVITGRADPKGPPKANLALSLQRAKAVAAAMRAAGATRADYHLVPDTSLRGVVLSDEVAAVWRPLTVHALMRRATVDLRAAPTD